MSMCAAVVLSTCLRIPADVRASSATAFDTNPKTNAASPRPNDHPTKPGSDSRSAKRVGEPNSAWRGARSAPWASTAAPASRPWAIHAVAAVSAAIHATSGSNAIGRAPVRAAAPRSSPAA
jgi:hypothetical protein